MLGGVGGFLVRGFRVPVSSSVSRVQQTVHQTQQPIPYSTPIAPVLPQQTLDPAENPVTF